VAGSSASFDGAAFRDAIRQVMELAAPVNQSDQAVFHFASERSSTAPTDVTGTPFDPSATVTSTAKSSVSLDCVIEYVDIEDDPTHFGLLSPSKIRILLLDEEYVQVAGCQYVVVAGNKYIYRRTDVPVGLYDVGIYTMHFVAENEA
jgi:hypothetical protein